jgi:hypothetical protein
MMKSPSDNRWKSSADGQPARSNEVVSRGVYGSFLRALEDDPFLTAAQKVLEDGTDPHQLAVCAEQAGCRLPGGPYFRARLWAKVVRLLSPDEVRNRANQRLAELCQGLELESGQAKCLAAQGTILAALERRRVRLDGLLHAPQQVFDAAPKRRENAQAFFFFVNRLLRQRPRLTPRQVQQEWCAQHGSRKANLDIIKPSDWWAFSHPKWRRDPDFPGSIPGEVYANALYYFAPRKGVAVDPMAGSGMLLRVYRDRGLWQKDSDFDLTVCLFDLHPCRNFIGKHDARRPLPLKADWIFLDPPYFGQSSHLYDGDLANAGTYPEYLAGLGQVIAAMAVFLNTGGRLCVLLPKWSGLAPDGENHDVPADICRFALAAGLVWMDSAFVSRARQQEAGFAFQNIAAKRARRMLSDTCVLNVFEKKEAGRV